METRFTYSDAHPKTIEERIKVAELLAQAGMVKGGPAQAFAVIQMGAELGMGPMEAVRAIHLMQGKPTLDATAVAALVQRSGKYRFIQEESTTERCVIRFEAGVLGKWEVLGTSTFTIEDARRAKLTGKGTWAAYPDQMLRARALTKGARQFVPEVFGGPIYVPEELELASGSPAPVAPRQEQPPAAPEGPNEPTDRQRELAKRITALAQERFGDKASDVLDAIIEKLGVESLPQASEKQLMATGKRLKSMSLKEAQDAFGVDLGQLTDDKIDAVVATYCLDDSELGELIAKWLTDSASLEALEAAIEHEEGGNGPETRELWKRIIGDMIAQREQAAK